MKEDIIHYALAWSIECAEVKEIDCLNIFKVTMLLAMQRAVAGLEITPYLVLIDGNCCPITITSNR